MSPEEAINLAIDFIESGDFPSAELVYRKILEHYPNNKLVSYLIKDVEGSYEASLQGTYGQKRLLKHFKTQVSHYNLVPEYNLNWGLASLGPVQGFLATNPLTIVDIGARDSSLGEVEDLKQYVNLVGFDADSAECDRLNKNPPEGFYSYKILPYFIGKSGATVKFHIYKAPGESSVFRPNPIFKSRYSSSFSIDRSIDVEPIELYRALAHENVIDVDLIKLDTQGSELHIIQTSPNVFDRTLLVESEVEWVEMYEGQPLVGDFLNHMFALGFEVLYVNRVFINEQDYHGPARGQLVFSDMLFVKRQELLHLFPPHNVAKHVILLCTYGHLDRAFSIWKANREIQILLPRLLEYFQPYKGQVERVKEMARDKTLCWQLHRRKFNQLPIDSDRSWPIR